MRSKPGRPAALSGAWPARSARALMPLSILRSLTEPSGRLDRTDLCSTHGRPCEQLRHSRAAVCHRTRPVPYPSLLVTPCAQPLISPTKALAITDDGHRSVLLSTRIYPRTAVRRGAARPQRSDQAATGETLSRAGRRPHRRACMGCRVPRAPSTRTRLGVPARGRSAWWPRRSGCRPRLRQPVHVLGQRRVSGVRCLVRAASVHACLSTGPVSGVRCGRLRVQVSAVRCRRPVSVRCRVRCVRPK